jgi:Zn-dependent protease with chaperone function
MSKTQDIYPAGPVAVPPNLTDATSRYKRHAWIAVAALLLFALLYIGLAGWFIWEAWRAFAIAFVYTEHLIRALLIGVPSLFFAAFMIKGLFFVKHGSKSQSIELHAYDEPELFAFLYKLADEARAPRPHRVFVSATVNAAVFYDLSIINFFFPSRKNLEIGLALINVLTLGEFKAVLAHEFGHFAQRSMAVGRWVYIAQQVAEQIVARRDGFDRFLNGLMRLDIRVALVGWALGIVVWSIRSLIQQSFGLLLLAQRALGREMEMQADLVAVSLTGSDALVHALHKTSAADDAWNRTLQFANREYGKGRQVRDLLTVQSRILSHLRMAYDDADYGRSPVVPKDDAAQYRVFKSAFAQLPQMWATHPSNHEREQNAKKVYVAVPLDERSAWTVFHRAKEVREQVSLALVERAGSEIAMESDEEALSHVDEEYSKEFLNRFYRSVYLGRSVVRHAKSVSELYENYAPLPDDALSRIYPPDLSVQLEVLRELQGEQAMLKAVRDGKMQAAGKRLRYRDRDLSRADLPTAIAEVEKDAREREQQIQAHDRLCRTVHMRLAQQMAAGWDVYLKSLLGLMHFADHVAADLRDVQSLTGHVYQLMVSTGKINKEKFQRLLDQCTQLFTSLRSTYELGQQVQPGAAILARIGIDDWPKHFGEFRFAAPTQTNLQEWLSNVDSWVNAAHGNLRQLYEAALSELLKTEALLARAANSPQARAEMTEMRGAPAPATYPGSYPILLPGAERSRDIRLDWRSRLLQGNGRTAKLVKLIALPLVAGVLIVGTLGGRPQLTIYNGLAIPVQVTVGSDKVTIRPNEFEEIRLPIEDDVSIRANAGAFEIEQFNQHIDNAFAHYVYNIGRATPMVQWYAAYGNAVHMPPKVLGNPRWIETNAAYVFTEPPRSVSTKSGEETLTVLSAVSKQGVMSQLGMLPGQGDTEQLIGAHVRFDPPNSPHFPDWMLALATLQNAPALTQERLKNYPDDVLALRAESDYASVAQRVEVCRKHTGLAQQHPDNGDLQYLAIRCMAHDDPQKLALQKQALQQALTRFPNNAWLHLFAGYNALSAEQMDEALQHFNVTFAQMPDVHSWVNIDIARLRRLQDPNADLGDLIKDAPLLDSYHDLETNTRQIGPAKTWSELISGDLEHAYQHASSGRTGSRLSLLLAASDGAPRQWALQELTAGANDEWARDMAFYGLALAVREHRDATSFKKRIAELGDDPQMDRIFQAMQDKTPVDDADLAALSLSDRGTIETAGLIMQGRTAPEKWRVEAKRLLFGTERPYFQ